VTASHTINVEKVFHHGQTVILLRFRQKPEWLYRIKALYCSKYSATYRCYYIPYDKRSYNTFKALNIPHVIPTPKIIDITPQDGNAKGVLSDQHISDIDSQKNQLTAVIDNGTSSTSDISRHPNGDLQVILSNQYFQIKTNYHEGRIKKIKTLKKSWWNENTKTWICYGSYQNLTLIQKLFHYWNPQEIEIIEQIIRQYDKPCHVTMYQVPQLSQMIVIEITGYKKITNPILRIKNRRYNKAIERWTVPYHPDIAAQLIEDYKVYGIDVIDRLITSKSLVKQKNPSNRNRLEKLLSKYKNNDRKIATEISSLMMSQRYSWQTIRTYTIALVKYNQWLEKQDIHESDNKQINEYLTYVSGQKVSDSLLNIQISALKYYYDKVLSRVDINMSKIKRPRKSHRLPRILSQKEVLRMIKVTSNMKHRNILYAIYSSGMRLSELTDLRIDNIIWDRNQIFIRGAKGKKDRVVMLSAHIKEVFKEYFHEYKPAVYLFESIEAGKKYANSSVQKIVKTAANKAGITRNVTPHVLRHCFATHLHDNGISIAFIQELLGHKNLKTTLVYTHISIQQISKIESPLDQLMRKSNTSDDEKVGI